MRNNKESAALIPTAIENEPNSFLKHMQVLFSEVNRTM